MNSHNQKLSGLYCNGQSQNVKGIAGELFAYSRINIPDGRCSVHKFLKFIRATGRDILSN